MKKYLYKKWKEERLDIISDMYLLEEEFRGKGCSVCGPAKEGNGAWIVHGGEVLICPHLKAFINRNMQARIEMHQLLLKFISTPYPADVRLLLDYELSQEKRELRRSRTREGKTLAVCKASKPL